MTVRFLGPLAVLVFAACDSPARPLPRVPPPPPPVTDAPVLRNPCTVTRIYDGDTFACTPGSSTTPVIVRILSVDAPETAQRLGAMSTAILRHELPIGLRVGLTIDVDSLDAFGRTLAWVETPDRPNLSLWLAEDGWVTDLIIAPNVTLAAPIRAAVARARADRRGLWAYEFERCLPAAFRRGDCAD